MAQKKDEEKDTFQKISDGIRFAPDAVFDSLGASSPELEDPLVGNPPQQEQSGLDNFQKSFQEFLDEKPKTVADGVFKGILSIGSGVVQGITGIVTEPMKEVQKKGAIGVVTGVGKGITGLVTKPLAGVFDMGVKTTQGVINTPSTISRAASKMGLFDGTEAPPEFPIFGEKHEISLQNAEKMKIVHPTISIMIYLRKNGGITTQGIFRESGNVIQIKQIIDDYNYGKEPKLEEFDVRELSGVLKNYLRSLPEPLLSYDLYSQFLNVLKSSAAPDRDAHLYKTLIKSLPSCDKLLLQSFLSLLFEIQKNSDINKMTSSNLSIVFGPSILRPRESNAASELFDMPDVTKVVNFLILHHTELF